MSPRAPTRSVGPPAPNTMTDMIMHSCGLGWHGRPTPFGGGYPSVVGASRRSFGYAFDAPTHALRARVPRIWGRGIRGTRANARVAARSPFRSPF